jgi:hypothetical protein
LRCIRLGGTRVHVLEAVKNLQRAHYGVKDRFKLVTYLTKKAGDTKTTTPPGAATVIQRFARVLAKSRGREALLRAGFPRLKWCNVAMKGALTPANWQTMEGLSWNCK